MTSCHSVLNFRAFLRHSTWPNFDWNIFETTLKPPGFFHHPKSPVISPDKAGTLHFFYHLCVAPKGQRLRRSHNALKKSKGCPSWSHDISRFCHMKSWERNMENPAKSRKVWVEITLIRSTKIQAMMLANWHQHWMKVSLQASMNQWTWRKVNNANMPTWNICPQWYTPKKSTRSPPTIQHSLHVGCATKMRIHSHLLKTVVSAPWSSTNAGTHSTSVQLVKKWSQFTSQCRTICYQ